MSGLSSSSPEDKKKFERFRIDGIRVLQEIEDLKGSLKDTTKALAEEYNLPPGKLSEALRVAFKNSLAEKKEGMDIIEEFLHISGYDE